MKKVMNLILLVFVGIFMVGFGSANSALTDSDGDEYYDIHNCSELQNMSLNLSANYELMNDIDCSDTVNWNSGAGFNPVGNSSNSFTGNFNGEDYIISNLFISRSSAEGYVGLFGYSLGNISNVGLVNVDIYGGPNSGGLIGYSSGFVNNSYSTGNVDVYPEDNQGLGGLIGSSSGSVSNCYSLSNVNGASLVGGLIGFSSGSVSNCYSTGNVTGSSNVGGLIGFVDVYTVSNSYSTGNVTGSSNVGGLIGDFGGMFINRSYSVGSITGSSGVGGLIGTNSMGGSIFDSYYNNETSGQNDNDGRGEPKTTAEMKNISTFTDWEILPVSQEADLYANHSYVWNMVDGSSYPFLSWQYTEWHDITAPNVTLFSIENSTLTSRTFTFNVSDESDVDNCSLYVYHVNGSEYSTSGNVNSSINKSINNTITKSDFLVGNYYANIGCVDSYGSEGFSEDVSFEVQSIPVEEEKPTSSGGSSGPLSYSVSESSLKNGFTRNMRKSDSLKFSVNNEAHNLTVSEINNKTITIIVRSEPQTFNINLNGSVNVDLNKDGIYDLEISYLKYFTTLASLKIKAISLAYELPKVVEEEQEETKAPFGLEEEILGGFALNKYIFWSIFGVVVIVIIGLVILFVRKIFLSAKKEIGKKNSSKDK